MTVCLIDVFGVMYSTGMTIDIVSPICIAGGIGLSVDYITHIVHAQIDQSWTGVQERAVKNFIDIGPAIFNGGVTTLIGILPIAASVDYLYFTVFKLFTIIVSVGLFHGLLVLGRIAVGTGTITPARLKKYQGTFSNA